MKLEDLYSEQLVALIRVYSHHPVGTKGKVIGYSESKEKALIDLKTKSRTQEYIPLNYLIGILPEPWEINNEESCEESNG